MEDFKKVFKKNDKGEDISNLNAAEILHILYFQHKGYHLFNKSMGGTGGSLTVISGNEIVKKAFTYTMSPKDAYNLFFANIEVLSRLRRLTDYFNRIVLTDE